MIRKGGTAVMVGMPKLGHRRRRSRRCRCSRRRRSSAACTASAQVRRDFPRLISLIETGRLDVGSMVPRTIHLDEVNDAFRAMEAGEVIRSVIV